MNPAIAACVSLFIAAGFVVLGMEIGVVSITEILFARDGAVTIVIGMLKLVGELVTEMIALSAAGAETACVGVTLN